MTSRIGEKIAKRCGRSVEHQQAVLFPLGEAIAPGEFEDTPHLLARFGPFRIVRRRLLRSEHGGDYSAAASAGFTSGKKAANSLTTSPIRFESASEETA